MPITIGRTTRAFRACENKGFHITFKNRWTISVQFGPGNYCENYELLFERRKVEDLLNKPEYESDDAEVWSFNGKDNYPKDPLPNQTPEQVLAFMMKVSKKRGRRQCL